jgi:hypothetical protein
MLEDKELENALNSINVTYEELKDAARKNGMDTLFESGMKKVEEGLTSVDEILEISKTRMLTEEDIPNPYNHLSYRAWNHVLAGLGKFSKGVAEKSITDGMADRYELWRKKTLVKLQDYKDLEEALIVGDWVT